MRISFILSSLWLSGGMRVIVECANHLTRRGHRVSLVAPGGTRDPDMLRELAPEVEVKESQVPRQPRMNMLQQMRLSWSLAQAVPASDVVISTHTPTTPAGLLASRLLSRARLVWLYQDYREMFIGRPVEDWLARHALRWHQLALVPSAYSRQELNEFSGGQVVIMSYGLSHRDTFQPVEYQPRNNGEQNILFLGDMRPRKGLYDFLKAAAIVHSQLKNIKLLIVSKEDCQIESEVPFEYIYRPSPPELAHLYATCDLFVSASWWESFGLPPLEAMACGAPIVLTDSRGAREYARPEENCLMVPAQDPQALAEAMCRVLGDKILAERFRRNGPPMAARFTWENAVNRLENALNSLFETPG